MIETATGLVLRTRPLTETSLIIHWLTPTLGRLATAAKGAQRPKSPFRGKLDLFYLADFSFTRSRRSDLHTLSEVSLLGTHPALRRDLGSLRQAAYAATLIEQTTESDTPLPEIYDLMLRFLGALAQRPPQPRMAMAFELKLLSVLGLEPDFGSSALGAGAKGIAQTLLTEDWPAIALLTATATEAAELGRFLHTFLIFHLGKLPKNRAAALHPAAP
jgi:DNA repair protein RecO (recombination protein O)